MKQLLFLILISFPIVGHHTARLMSYHFNGEHYIASFHGCEKLDDNKFVLESFIEAVWMSGARFCDVCKHEFYPQGMTAVCVLHESHASIHTYPECESVYIDLFTCGDKSYWERFEEILVEKFKPKGIQSKVIKR